MRSQLISNFAIRSLPFCLIVLFLTIDSFAQQGALDTSFGTNNTGIYQDPLPALDDPTNLARHYGPIQVLPDGRVLTAGSYTKNFGGGNYVNGLVIRRLNADGSADTTFANRAGNIETTFYTYNGAESNMLQDVMGVQPWDGKIVIAAQCTVTLAPPPGNNALGSDLCLMRFTADGTLDTSFGGNTVTAFGGNGNFPPQSYTMDPGKVWTYTGRIVFFPNVTGNGFGGIPVRIRFTPDHKIVVFGNSEDLVAPNGGTRRFKGFVAVYSTNGTLESITDLIDTTGNTTDGFGSTHINDGDILSNGDFFSVGSQSRLVSTNPAVFTNPKWAVFRNGTAMFLNEQNNNLPEGAFGLAQLRSNKILVGGGTSGNGGTFVRYNGDLSVDTTFGTDGRLIPPCNGNFCIGGAYIGGMYTQPDGKIMGFGDPGNIFRINPDGTPDRSFGYPNEIQLTQRGILPNGAYITPFPTRGGTDQRIFYGGFDQRPNGTTVVSGSTGTSPGGPVAQAVAIQIKTYLRNGGTFGDFNNDGKTEVSVYRPSESIWHRLDSFTGDYAAAQWGISTDKIAPADYDGDGKTDLTVFRDGVWYINRSSDGQIGYENFGAAGDLPVPGDYNGDGQADIAVFRPSEGNWYIHYSNPIQPGNITFTSFHFGQAGDVPIFADFDGDGKSDITIFRDGAWYQLLSASDFGFRYIGFGLEGDIPVAADYDADGKADIAVFRAGTWYVMLAANGNVIAQPWGIAADVPVPGDYDNDGRSDFAIYRDGVWWILRSSDNTYSATYFGLQTDIPIPAAYQY